jgi:pimeloyl-ACP methyl ester carboxylesterase
MGTTTTIAGRTAGVAVAAWLLAVVLAWDLQDRFVFPGANGDVPHSETMPWPAFSQVAVKTHDGLKLAFWASPPRRTMPIIVYLHGNGETAMDPSRSLLPFARMGYGVALLEFRGYGNNPGRPSENDLIEDSRAQVAWVARQWPGSPLVFWGESLGTGVAVALAADGHAAGLVLDSPFTSIREVAGRLLPFAPVSLLLRHPFESLSKLPDVAAPVLVITGEADGVVPPDMGHTMLAAARCPGSVGLFLPGVPHMVYRNDTSGQAGRSVAAFLDGIRGGAGAPCAAAAPAP